MLKTFYSVTEKSFYEYSTKVLGSHKLVFILAVPNVDTSSKLDLLSTCMNSCNVFFFNMYWLE